MDDYTREMMDLKTLVTRTLEKKGVLAKIRAELRASVFEAIEEEDRAAIDKEENLPLALLGSCNSRAKHLHASPSGRLLTALICEYLDWAELGHTLKVYLPECNLPKDFWKSELNEFSSKNGYDLSRSGESGPLLLDVLEGFLKFETIAQTRSSGRRAPSPTAEADVFPSVSETRNSRRPAVVAGGLPPLGRMPSSSSSSGSTQAADRRGGTAMPAQRKDSSWRYVSDDTSNDVFRASTALENLRLDRRSRLVSAPWRHSGGGGGGGPDDDDRST